jgi:hypothetical protein
MVAYAGESFTLICASVQYFTLAIQPVPVHHQHISTPSKSFLRDWAIGKRVIGEDAKI